jgi:hypothetical protein
MEYAMSNITREDIENFIGRIHSDPLLIKNSNPYDSSSPENQCLYQDGEGKHCIVGHWLHNEIGIDDEWMECNIEGKSASQAVELALDDGFIDEIDCDAVAVLEFLQQSADQWHVNEDNKIVYTAWGDCIDFYYDSVSEGSI